MNDDLMRALVATVWALRDCRDYGECLLKGHLAALTSAERALRAAGIDPETITPPGGDREDNT